MANEFFKELKLEMKLDGVSWTDVTADVRANAQYSLQYGMPGHRPTNRIATTGRLKFSMNNSAKNSGGLRGYYSPGHINIRTGFELNVPVRLSVRAGTFYGDDKYGDFYYGADPYYRFTGKLRRIRVIPGQKGKRRTECTAYDFIHEMSKHKMDLLALMENVASGTVFSNVIANMDDSPDATSYATGIDTFPYAGDDMQDERTTALAAARKITISEFGYVYIKGDELTGGVLVFEDRQSRVGGTPLFTIDDDDLVSMEVNRPLDQVYNKIRTLARPREVGGSPEVLYTLQTTSLVVKAGETEVIKGRYSDPDQRSVRIAGKDLVTLVADTDFEFGSSEGAGNNDKNADLTITVTEGATTVKFSMNNTSGASGFVNKLQVRGTALRTFEPVERIAEDVTSQAAYDDRELKLDLVYQDDPLVAQERATALLAAYKDPRTYIKKITLRASRGASARYMSRLDVGDRITLSEDVTGISAKDYIVHLVTLNFMAPDTMEATYLLRLATTEQAWLLGVVNYSELADTTILGGASV